MTARQEQIGKRIQKLRKEAGISQQKLSEATGLSMSFIGNVEIGKKSPGMGSLQKIAKALKVKVSDLIPF